jgi:hypothetical protein
MQVRSSKHAYAASVVSIISKEAISFCGKHVYLAEIIIMLVDMVLVRFWHKG